MFEFQLMSWRYYRSFPDLFVTLHKIETWSHTSRNQKEFVKMLKIVFHFWNNCFGITAVHGVESEVAVGVHGVTRKACWSIRRNVQANVFQCNFRLAYKYILVLKRKIITYLTFSNRPWSCLSWIDYLCFCTKWFNL